MVKQNLAKILKNNDVELAPIDKETAERIKRAVEATDSNAMSVIHEAMKVFEKALGRELTIRKKDSKWDLSITKYKKFKTIQTFEPTE